MYTIGLYFAVADAFGRVGIVMRLKNIRIYSYIRSCDVGYNIIRIVKKDREK